jgi:hypothetical protein
VEKGGFIWLFYGSKDLPADERPPVPYCEELDDPAWQPVFGELEFECGHWAVFENAIDMAHIHYLHGDTFGNKDNPMLHDMKVRHLPCVSRGPLCSPSMQRAESHLRNCAPRQPHSASAVRGDSPETAWTCRQRCTTLRL